MKKFILFLLFILLSHVAFAANSAIGGGVGGGGGSGTPGGSDGEIQYNNNGSFDGDPSLTFDNSSLVLSSTDAGRFSLAEASTNGTNKITYKVPDALTSDVTVTMRTNGDIPVDIEIFGPTADIAVGDGRRYYKIPALLDGWVLVGITGQVITAGTTGTTDIQVARCNATSTGNVCSGTVVDMLSTKLTIDSGENSSATAAIAASINTSNDDVATNQVVRIDIDAVQTTVPKGLNVTLIFRQPN